jgi:hypothetical protein
MKKFNTTSKAIALFIAGSILFSSCASTTLIDSVPSGADLYLDGEYVGVTPQSMTDTKLIGTCTTVRIEKENYRNYYGSICRTEEADPGAIIGGVFFFFPFFWAMKYKPSHFYKLQPLSGDKASVDQLKAGEATLDQLLNSESNEKSQKMSVEDKAIDADNDGIIKLDEGSEISPEEFEQQKADKPE